MSGIYNKNAREKVLLEEAYTGVYKEAAVDVELDHWWDFDEHDIVLKVYHGALRAMPPEEGTPEYEANSEKIFTWLKGKYPQPDEYHPGYGKVEDAEMEFDERGFVKNTEAGYEREDRPGGEDHDRFVKIAHEALDMIKDELHIGGYGEDININELTDGHNQLSRALIAILGEEQAIDIMGGQADRQAEAEQDFKPADGREY